MKHLFALLFICAAPAAAQQKTVTFTTADSCKIEAFYAAPSSGAYVFINTHGLGSDRHEWGSFQAELARRGHGWLSLDLRGHGNSRSCGGKPADYRKFTKADWARASADIEAAAAWLKKKGLPAARQIFCGASIGANLSVKAAAEGAVKPAALILLSPGLDYAGTKPERYLSKAPGRLLFAAAPDDPYAWQSAAALAETARRAGLRVSTLDGGSGHGVNMFRTEGRAAAVLDWAGGGR